MDTALYYLAILTLVAYWVFILEFHFGNRTIQALQSVPPVEPDRDHPPGQNLPSVSIVIPARNEARNIEEALTSVLQLDYPNYEITVLNDRSEDGTGAILERLAQRYPMLRVVHITELPDGWLGKNHALHEGARQSDGELLLFTDADIVMAPSSLSRAVKYLQERKLDHLAIMPELRMPGFWLNWFACGFSIFFAMYSRPWWVKLRQSPFHIGIGAFNLIRHDCYEAVGTHQAIAMRPDDDMKLGRLVKKNGFRQDLLYGAPLISVEWYRSMRELIDGLMKNAFAGLEYSVVLVILGLTGQTVMNVWPVLAVFLTDGPLRLLNLLIWISMLVLSMDNGRYYKIRPLYSFWCGLGFPLVSLLMLYIIAKSTIQTLVNDGISWRGTHYSLKALRANRV